MPRDDSSENRGHNKYRHEHCNNRPHSSNRSSLQDKLPYSKYKKKSERNKSPSDIKFRESKRNSPDSRNNKLKPTQNQDTDKTDYKWGKKELKDDLEPKINSDLKEKPNFGLSGKLVEDTNMVNGVVIKYSEPDDAKKPNHRWRLYPFKEDKQLPVLHIHRCSAFLLGRDRKIADIPIDHPSCSKQHAVLQYRLVSFKKSNGYEGKKIRPYLIDLESANGTFINGEKIETRKYYELMERDVIKFGLSTREYVLLHEHSKGDDMNDDV